MQKDAAHPSECGMRTGDGVGRAGDGATEVAATATKPACAGWSGVGVVPCQERVGCRRARLCAVPGSTRGNGAPCVAGTGHLRRWCGAAVPVSVLNNSAFAKKNLPVKRCIEGRAEDGVLGRSKSRRLYLLLGGARAYNQEGRIARWL